MSEVKKWLIGILPIFMVILATGTAYCADIADTLSFGRFGKVFVYSQNPHPSNVVLFVSGDGGWNLGVVDMAKTLSSLDATIVGIDITRYLRNLQNSSEKCLYPASDFEELSKFIQKKYEFQEYVTPILIGYSSGATLVYAVLVQAPSQTFKGAVSMGFCPDLPLVKPMCKGNGLESEPGPKGKGYVFLPATNLEVPWIVLQGMKDEVCDAATTVEYVKKVKNGKLVTMDKVGHGFSVPRNWLPQFKEAFSDIVKEPTNTSQKQSIDIKDIPVVEIPSEGKTSDLMAIFLSGDGGWGTTDRGVSNELASRGIPVAGLNSLHYFWKPKTTETASKDLEKIINYYTALWKKNNVMLIGYSLGADVLPFMINGLSKETRDKVKLAVFIGPSRTVDFEFHLTDWVSDSSRKSSKEVLPELKKLKGMKMLFFYGEEEKESLCRDIDSSYGKIVQLKGGHRVGSKFGPIVDDILKVNE